MNKQKLSLTQEVLSSFEQSLKEKRKTFIGMCTLSTWFNMQILNLCHDIVLFTTFSKIYNEAFSKNS